MSDPTDPTDEHADDEETSDKGGDSDPDANEGFAPPEDRTRGLATLG